MAQLVSEPSLQLEQCGSWPPFVPKAVNEQSCEQFPDALTTESEDDLLKD